ncbi:MAG: TonB-dependent receptor plug domain-containing protein, partial [Hyphomicrobiaceae bacterium]
MTASVFDYRVTPYLAAFASACALSALVVSAPQVSAQTVLPGIVVEGATLEKAPVTRPRVAPQVVEAPAIAPKALPKAAQKSSSVPQQKAASVATPTQVATQPSVGSNSVIGGSAGDVAGGVPTRQLGSAVTVIAGKDLEQQQVRTVAEALRGQPGVTINTYGSVGSVTSVSLRGEKSKYTRVIIDGVDASTTKDGDLDFSTLSTESIERIEVIRGPMSALYGSGAMGGVINIITKAPKGPLSGSVRVEGGSFGTKDLAGTIGGGGDNGYLSVSGQLRDIKGFNISPSGFESDGTRLGTVNVRAGVTLAPTAKLDFTLRHTEKKAAYDAFGADFVTPASQRPYQTADDADNVLRQKQSLAGVRLSWDSFGGALTQELKSTYNRDVSVNRETGLPGTPWYFAPATVVNSSDKSTRLNYGYGLTYRVAQPSADAKHTFSGLIERETETFTPFSDYDTFFGDYNGDGIERRRNR